VTRCAATRSREGRERCAARTLVGLAAIAALALDQGCASRPVNERIVDAATEDGYSVLRHVEGRPNHDPSTLFVLAFSGGGTRAAAFSYGVLEELRRTPIVVDGRPRRLLDDVDVISSVSGGSFTALAYAMYGERLFAEYESRFLNRDVEGALLARAFNPFYWPRLAGGSFGRSELAADYYDEILFEGATFGDLAAKPTPVSVPSATDLATGDRFPFRQGIFNLICSDLATVRLSRAAAASSAVPVVLSPVTFNNYGGSCGFRFPAWITEEAATLSPYADVGRALRRLQELQSLENSEARPYLHLVDGGVSDNVAVRAIVEFLEAVGAGRRGDTVPILRDVRRVVVIVVNAASSPTINWGRIPSAPGIFDQLWQASSVPIDRYSYESIDLLDDLVSRWALERQLAIADARLAGTSASQAPTRPALELYVIDASFRDVADPKERQYLENLPTSFVLPPGAVDRLRAAAGSVLQASPRYRDLVDALGGHPLDANGKQSQ